MNEDKQLGIYFIDKDTLCEEKFDINNSLDKEKMEKFGSKILEYLWNDISKFDHNFIFTNSNGLFGYIPLRDRFAPTVYESKLGCTSYLEPEAGYVFTDTALELANKAK